MNAIGGLVHHTSIAGTDTLGAFPNPAIWSMSAGNLLLLGIKNFDFCMIRKSFKYSISLFG